MTFDIESQRDRGASVVGPELPARIEAHGALAWVLPQELLGNFKPGTPIVGYTHRYKTLWMVPGWIKKLANKMDRNGRVWKFISKRESPVREYVTKKRYTKN